MFLMTSISTSQAVQTAETKPSIFSPLLLATEFIKSL